MLTGSQLSQHKFGKLVKIEIDSKGLFFRHSVVPVLLPFLLFLRDRSCRSTKSYHITSQFNAKKIARQNFRTGSQSSVHYIYIWKIREHKDWFTMYLFFSRWDKSMSLFLFLRDRSRQSTKSYHITSWFNAKKIASQNFCTGSQSSVYIFGKFVKIKIDSHCIFFFKVRQVHACPIPAAEVGLAKSMTILLRVFAQMTERVTDVSALYRRTIWG